MSEYVDPGPYIARWTGIAVCVCALAMVGGCWIQNHYALEAAKAKLRKVESTEQTLVPRYEPEAGR